MEPDPLLYEGVNSTNYTDSEFDGNQFILPLWHQLIWTFLFSGMVVVATGGNLIVIWIVLWHKRMRTVTNYFLVNLSIADAMVSTLNVTFNYTYMVNSNWPFGRTYCKISQFVAVLSICASVFTLMAISIDRYMAIMYPLRPRMGRRMTLFILAVIWIVGSALSAPMLVFFTTEVQDFPNGDRRVVCYSVWPDGETNDSNQEYLYNVFFMVTTYFLPIGSMCFTYARVGLELWGSKSIGESTARQAESIKSKRRVVKMMMVVVSIFAVCWLPFHIYFIVTAHVPEITTSPYIQDVYLAIYWLAMSNSMYNPIIYCWMNNRFRRGFKQFFRWCPFVDMRADRLTRREVLTSRYASCSGSPEAPYRIARNDAVGDRTMTSDRSEDSSQSDCTSYDTILELGLEVGGATKGQLLHEHHLGELQQPPAATQLSLEEEMVQSRPVLTSDSQPNLDIKKPSSRLLSKSCQLDDSVHAQTQP